MKKLHISFLQRIDNKQFQTIYSYFLEYMENREFEDPTFITLLKRMQGHKDDVGDLINIIEKYNETEKIGELTRLRTDYFISLRLEIKAKRLSYVPQMRIVAERLYAWLNNFKKRPYIQSIIAQHIVVGEMLHDRIVDSSLREDITSLNLDGLIDAIDEVTQQIEENLALREKEKILRLKKGKEIRNGAYDELKTLTDYIESQLRIVPVNKEESEYYNIILDLHPKLKAAHTILKSRITRNKNKRKIAKLALLTTCQQDPATRPLPMVITEVWKNINLNNLVTDTAVKSLNSKPSNGKKATKNKHNSKVKKRKNKD